MRRITSFVIVAALLVVSAPIVRAQNVSVSDVTAYRELFLMVSRQTVASVSHLRFVSLPGVDQSKFELHAKEFRTNFDALVETYNAKAEVGLATPEEDFWPRADALTYETMTKMVMDLSPLGAKKLKAVVQRFKANINSVAATSTSKHDHGLLKPAAFHPGSPQGCVPQNNYTRTWTSSVDNNNFYLSTVTSGTGSMPPYCGHGNYQHTAVAYNSINGISGQNQFTGCPACYISAEFDNSQPISAVPHDDFQTEVEGRVTCNFAGLFWEIISLLHFQLEEAMTTSQVLWNTKGVNGFGHTFYDATSSCPQISPPNKPDNPPDFPGPDLVFDTDPISTGWVRTDDFCARWAFWGSSFYGQPWFCANLPRTDSIIMYLAMASAPGQGQLCTLKDNGYEPPF